MGVCPIAESPGGGVPAGGLLPGLVVPLVEAIELIECPVATWNPKAAIS